MRWSWRLIQRCLEAVKLKSSTCLTFFLMWIFHFWNYDVPSRAWNPLQPLRLDFFIINSPLHPYSQLSFLNFCGQDNRPRWKARRSHELILLPNLITATTSPPLLNYHLSSSKAIYILRLALLGLCVPLEERFPCISRNIFFKKSPCSSFDIDVKHPIRFTPSSQWREIFTT